jgi:hypothetical protein
VLEVLASSPEGATEALLFAHGFMYMAITGLVDSGLATSTIEPFLADGRLVEVTRFQDHRGWECGAGEALKARYPPIFLPRRHN